LNKKNRDVIHVSSKDFPIFCPTSESGSFSMHPRVFLNMDKKKQVSCPYCGKIFRLKN